MTPELTAQLDKQRDDLAADKAVEQELTVVETGRYKQEFLAVDKNWAGEGILEHSVTEYVGPSELPEDKGAIVKGFERISRYTDKEGRVWVKSEDSGPQPSRNHDWQEQPANPIL